MIVSASYRTDIPAYYGDWFQARLRAGFAQVHNPYAGSSYRVSLDRADVSGFVFWTRNAAPFMPVLTQLAEERWPYLVQFTLTGYPRVLEPGVLDVDAALVIMADIAQRFGARRLVWRYDPIVLTDLTDLQWHQAQFTKLAAALEGLVDEVVISFAQIYRKSRRNLNLVGAKHNFSWRDPGLAEKQVLAAALADRAQHHGMVLRTCTQPDLVASGLPAARCIDWARLSDVAGYDMSGRTKGNRAGCLCAQSRDIGAYHTCPQGCAYCYAVSDRDRAKKALAGHDPAAVRL